MATRPTKKPPPKKAPTKKAPTEKAPTKKALPKKPPTARWRLATPDDHARIVSRSLALFREDPGTKPMTAARVRKTLAVLSAEPGRGVAVVAEVGGVVVGYGLLCSFWSNELHGEICTVDEFYVDASHRGCGVGTALMQLLQRGGLRRFKGAVALELEVTPVNKRARALYERLGFAPRKNATMRLLR